MTAPSVIAFDRRLGVGDILASVPAFYAAKTLCPSAKFILITNKIGASLCRNYEFIDEILIENIDFKPENLAEILDKKNVDILILGHRTSKNIKMAKQSKVPFIITWRHLHSLFSPRFHHPKHIKRLQRLEIKRCLDLVREINKKEFDKKFANLDLKNLPIKLKTDKKNKEFIDSYLQKVGAEKFSKIVLLSPFGISSAKFNLTMSDWVALGEDLAAANPKILFIFTNFKGSNFEFKPFHAANLKEFKNDDDLLNLAELTEHAALCISMSTGNIHLADLCGINALGFFAQTDEVLFACGNYGGGWDAVFLPKNWAQNYEYYKNEFFKKAQICVRDL